MYQEAEQGIWKPVLGALGAASMILTIVGNLVFSPKPSTLPAQAEPSRRIEPSPVAGRQSKSNATIVTRPIVTVPVEPQKTPCDAGSDTLLADQAAPAEHGQRNNDEVVGRSVELPTGSAETENPVPVLVAAEQAPPSEQAPESGQSVASVPVASAPIASAPIVDPESPDERANQVLVAGSRPEPEAIPSVAGCESRPVAMAVDNPDPIFVVQKLSHYERKMLRRIAHLENKRNRLFKDDCALVCR